jgi:hypothetical protein
MTQTGRPTDPQLEAALSQFERACAAAIERVAAASSVEQVLREMEVPCHPSIAAFTEPSQRRLFSAAGDRVRVLLRYALTSLRGKEGDDLNSAVASLRKAVVAPLKEARFLEGGLLESELERVERLGAKVLWPDPPDPCPPGFMVTGTTQSGKGVLLSRLVMAAARDGRLPPAPAADEDGAPPRCG